MEDNGKEKQKNQPSGICLGLVLLPALAPFLPLMSLPQNHKPTEASLRPLHLCSFTVAHTLSDAWETSWKCSLILRDTLGSCLLLLAQKQPMF